MVESCKQAKTGILGVSSLSRTYRGNLMGTVHAREASFGVSWSQTSLPELSGLFPQHLNKIPTSASLQGETSPPLSLDCPDLEILPSLNSRPPESLTWWFVTFRRAKEKAKPAVRSKAKRLQEPEALPLLFQCHYFLQRLIQIPTTSKLLRFFPNSTSIIAQLQYSKWKPQTSFSTSLFTCFFHCPASKMTQKNIALPLEKVD